MTAFAIPNPIKLCRRHDAEYQRMLTKGKVSEVNHGEFENAVNELIQQSTYIDEVTPMRPAALAIQRCRRGGKTFMLHAVASLLTSRQGDTTTPEKKQSRDGEESSDEEDAITSLEKEKEDATPSPKKEKVLKHNSKIVFISLNGQSLYRPDKEVNAREAICARVAWELTGQKDQNFRKFRETDDDFGEVDDWLTSRNQRIILIIDELNIIDHTCKGYTDMRGMLDNLMQQDGCALLYLTHQRSTADLLRGKTKGALHALNLLQWDHLWTPIPRIKSIECLRGLHSADAHQMSFWCAVLRGRIPALVVQEKISGYANGSLEDDTSPEE